MLSSKVYNICFWSYAFVAHVPNEYEEEYMYGEVGCWETPRLRDVPETGNCWHVSLLLDYDFSTAYFGVVIFEEKSYHMAYVKPHHNDCVSLFAGVCPELTV
jgi:hypothetical protein